MKKVKGDFSGASGVFRVDPVCDPRWSLFLEERPEASVFHTPAWLQALRRTYTYKPVAFTTTPPGGPLENGIVVCHVDSWLTGSRLVSLPFSDHCQPLVESGQDWATLSHWMQQQVRNKSCRYIELRPLASSAVGLTCFKESGEYLYHTLDLRPAPEALFRNFHKSCIQRKIERAQREGLTYEAGRSESILAKFYHLQLLTRRRHRLPPQPKAWFRNLIECFGNHLTIRVASKDGVPLASILTLHYRDTLVYKYGCSNARFHNLGGVPFLFWKAIQEALLEGLTQLDLGRSEIDNPGLSAFKERLGARRSKLTYFRLGWQQRDGARTKRQMERFRSALARAPQSMAQMVGSVLYRHIG